MELSEHSREIKNTYYVRNKGRYDYYEFLKHMMDRQPHKVRVCNISKALTDVDWNIAARLVQGSVRLSKQHARDLCEFFNTSLVEWAWHSQYVFFLFDDEWTDEERYIILTQCKWTSEESVLFRDLVKYANTKKDFSDGIATKDDVDNVIRNSSTLVINDKKRRYKKPAYVTKW